MSNLEAHFHQRMAEAGGIRCLTDPHDANLSRDMVGRQVVFRVTERIAIWLEKPQ